VGFTCRRKRRQGAIPYASLARRRHIEGCRVWVFIYFIYSMLLFITCATTQPTQSTTLSRLVGAPPGLIFARSFTAGRSAGAPSHAAGGVASGMTTDATTTTMVGHSTTADGLTTHHSVSTILRRATIGSSLRLQRQKRYCALETRVYRHRSSGLLHFQSRSCAWDNLAMSYTTDTPDLESKTTRISMAEIDGGM
jgi:hypothetical protein